MIFEPKEFVLKNGKKIIVKSPCEDDAEKLLNFIKIATSQSDFLLGAPEDMRLTIEDEKEYLKGFDKTPSYLLAVYMDGEIIANSNLSFDRHIKCRHRGDIGIAVRKEYWGQGIGSIIFEQFIELAKKKEGIEQLTLECLDTNVRGLALYKKFGFVETGRRPKYIKQKDGTYNDEITMTKFLED